MRFFSNLPKSFTSNKPTNNSIHQGQTDNSLEHKTDMNTTPPSAGINNQVEIKSKKNEENVVKAKKPKASFKSIVTHLRPYFAKKSIKSLLIYSVGLTLLSKTLITAVYVHFNEPVSLFFEARGKLYN